MASIVTVEVAMQNSLPIVSRLILDVMDFGIRFINFRPIVLPVIR